MNMWIVLNQNCDSCWFKTSTMWNFNDLKFLQSTNAIHKWFCWHIDSLKIYHFKIWRKSTKFANEIFFDPVMIFNVELLCVLINDLFHFVFCEYSARLTFKIFEIFNFFVRWKWNVFELFHWSSTPIVFFI